MAVSSSWDFIQTQQDIIRAALRKVRAIAPGGDAPSAQMESEASHALNSMVQSWQAEGIYLWTLEGRTQNLVQGTATYVLNSNVLGVLHPFIRVNVTDFPLDPITMEEYQAIPTKSDSGRPGKLWFYRTLGTSRVTLHSVPDQAYTLHYTAVVRLQDFDALADSPDFPSEWSEALIYGLASALAPEYDVSVEEQTFLRDESLRKRNTALLGTKETGSLFLCPKVR